MNKFFDLDNRKKLEFLLSDGFSLTIIQKKLDVTRSILYVKYNPIRAIIADIEIAVGKDSWNEVKNSYSKRKYNKKK